MIAVDARAPFLTQPLRVDDDDLDDEDDPDDEDEDEDEDDEEDDEDDDEPETWQVSTGDPIAAKGRLRLDFGH